MEKDLLHFYVIASKVAYLWLELGCSKLSAIIFAMTS
jgi:hypothetical protein